MDYQCLTRLFCRPRFVQVVLPPLNVEIECSQDASAVSCTGSIDLKDDVDQIIKGIVYATSLDFEKTDNKFRIF